MALAPRNASRTPDRPKRIPLGSRARLSFGNQDPDYFYRVINDKDDRLKHALEAGYEFVISDEKLGDERAAEGGAIDSRVSKPVGNGIRGYLMRIPKAYYEEDQNAKAAKLDEMELALQPEAKKKEIAEAYGEGLTKT